MTIIGPSSNLFNKVKGLSFKKSNPNNPTTNKENPTPLFSWPKTDTINLSNESKNDISNSPQNQESNIGGIIDGINTLNNQAKTKKSQQTSQVEQKQQAPQEPEVIWQPFIEKDKPIKQGEPIAKFIIKKPKKQETTKTKQNNKPLSARPRQKMKGNNMNLSEDKDGNFHIIDKTNGEKTKIPEDGIITAKRPMMISQVKNAGKLDTGSPIFSYYPMSK